MVLTERQIRELKAIRELLNQEIDQVVGPPPDKGGQHVEKAVAYCQHLLKVLQDAQNS